MISVRIRSVFIPSGNVLLRASDALDTLFLGYGASEPNTEPALGFSIKKIKCRFLDPPRPLRPFFTARMQSSGGDSTTPPASRSPS